MGAIFGVRFFLLRKFSQFWEILGRNTNNAQKTNVNAKPPKPTTSEARTQPKQDRRKRATTDAEKRFFYEHFPNVGEFWGATPITQKEQRKRETAEIDQTPGISGLIRNGSL